MYTLSLPELVDIHLDPKLREAIRTDPIRNSIFNIATVGHNMLSLGSYDAIARVIANCAEPKKLLCNDLPEEYDTSGYLV